MRQSTSFVLGITLGIACLAGLSGCNVGDVTMENAQWERISTPDNAASIEMPKKGEWQDQANGGATIKNYVCEFNLGNEAMLFSYVDFPMDPSVSDDPQALIDILLQGSVSAMSGTVRNEEETTLNGHPGKIVEFSGTHEGEEYIDHMRIYLVGTRVYMIQYLGKPGTLDMEMGKKYFDSLQIN